MGTLAIKNVGSPDEVSRGPKAARPRIPVLHLEPHAGPHDRWGRGRDRAGRHRLDRPRHDAWVMGEEPCIAVDFGGYTQCAKG